ncbi:hypothetical protein ZWY2020_031347 [Hordeum vulgare]|nr:hypothetical protein ZWY2020_031347 [Hordeum vulgare]
MAQPAARSFPRLWGPDAGSAVGMSTGSTPGSSYYVGWGGRQIGICSYWSSVIPAEVLIAIHDINPEKDKVPLKKDNTPTKVCTGVTSYKVDNIEKSMDNIASSENDPKASKVKELPNQQGLQQINSPERDNGFIVYKVENVVESHDNVQTEQNCTKRAPVAHAKDKGHCVKSSSTHHERFEEVLS